MTTRKKITVNQSLLTKYKRPIIIGIVCLIVLALAWFIFRKVKGLENERNYERELLIKQRVAAEQALISRDSLARAREDSIIMEMLGIKQNVQYRVIERKIYVEKFIDTASIATKFRYIDSLLGPR